MPFQPVLEAFGGNLKIVGTGASTANQHMPHFADDAEADVADPVFVRSTIQKRIEFIPPTVPTGACPSHKLASGKDDDAGDL